MTLREVINKGFEHIGNGNFNSVSILDKEGETIKVVSIKDLPTVDEEYLKAKFISIGTSTLKPDRLRIRIDYLE